MENKYCECCFKQLEFYQNCIIITDYIDNINEKKYLVHKECLNKYIKYNFNNHEYLNKKSIYCNILLNKWKLITMSCIFIALCLLVIAYSCVYINSIQDQLFDDNECYQEYYYEFYQAKIILIVNIFILTIWIVIVFIHMILKLIKKYNRFF